MGWSETSDRVTNIKAFIKSEFRYSPGIRMLDCAIVEFNTAYVALERIHPVTNMREVWCNVWLIKRGKTLIYKTVTEQEGPFEMACPERILKLLTPTADKSANHWRAACWRNVQQRNNRQRLVPGDVFELEKAIRFVGGFESQRFRMVNPRRLACQGWRSDGLFDPHRLYRLSRHVMLDMSFRLLEHGLPISVDRRGYSGVGEGQLLAVRVPMDCCRVVDRDNNEREASYYAALLARDAIGGCFLTLGPTHWDMADALCKRVSNYAQASWGLMYSPAVVQMTDVSAPAIAGSLNSVLPGWQSLCQPKSGEQDAVPLVLPTPEPG